MVEISYEPGEWELKYCDSCMFLEINHDLRSAFCTAENCPYSDVREEAEQFLKEDVKK